MPIRLCGLVLVLCGAGAGAYPLVVAELFYSSEFGGLEEVRRALSAAEVALAGSLKVVFHDYDAVEEYKRLRDFEKASGLAHYAPVEAFIRAEGSMSSLPLVGTVAIREGLLEASQGLLASAGTTADETLLRIASRHLPAAANLELLGEIGLFRLRGRLAPPKSPATSLGFIYLHHWVSDCPTCPDIRFAVVLDTGGAVIAVAPITPIVVDGFIYRGAFFDAFKGAREPERLALDEATVPEPAEPATIQRVPAIPGARKASQVYLSGVRRALEAVQEHLRRQGKE